MSESPFRGTWRNTDATSQSVTVLAFEPEPTRVHAWTAARGLGAGPIEVFGGIGDPTPVAFTARLPGAGEGEVWLQGNINRGLMILATYQWCSGDSVLAGRFSREFHARRSAGFVPSSAIAEAASPIRPSSSASVDPQEFVGRWVNAGEQGIVRSLTIGSAGSRLTLDVHGWPPGESWLFGYLDELGHETLLLLGRFELPEGRADLQIKVVMGTAVIAGFHTRNDGRSWFGREFLHQPRGRS